jgi:hypothetical protein
VPADVTLTRAPWGSAAGGVKVLLMADIREMK